ncbi:MULTISPECIES: ankyrin repeat domain-containing protein [Candidatus Cardinium]|uniref:ankyrin repeat domain-containing protein n=1 Tax=Candidatus Cardinium TaxID=273135 RepID=UPI001FAA3082|nr:MULTISPECIES: ankyrin repeat domain-containing protein [Cardinium]
MKTKKTYTRSRISLFIGLLSFHTLSSCVNTGRQLGMDCFKSKEKKQKKKRIEAFYRDIKQTQQANLLNHQPPNEDLKFNLVKEPWYKSKLGIIASVLGTTTCLSLIGTSIYLYIYNWSSETNPVLEEGLMRNYIGNGTTTEVMNNVSTTVSSIVNTIKDVVAPGIVVLMNGTAIVAGANELANLNNSNVSDNRSAVTPPEIAIDKFGKLYEGNVSIDCSPFKIDDPTAITQEIIDYLEEKSYLPEAIQCLLDAGLHKDAKDLSNNTLLMRTTKINNYKAVKFLVSVGADQNLKNMGGNTAIMYADLSNDEGKKIANYLGSRNDTNLCIKNNNAQSLKDKEDIKLFQKNIQEKIKKCI